MSRPSITDIRARDWLVVALLLAAMAAMLLRAGGRRRTCPSISCNGWFKLRDYGA